MSSNVPIQVVNLRLTDNCILSADVTDCLASMERGTRRTLTLAEMHTGSNGAGQEVGGNLTLNSKARVFGDIKVGSLVVERGGRVTGKIEMSAEDEF